MADNLERAPFARDWSKTKVLGRQTGDGVTKIGHSSFVGGDQVSRGSAVIPLSVRNLVDLDQGIPSIAARAKRFAWCLTLAERCDSATARSSSGRSGGCSA